MSELVDVTCLYVLFVCAKRKRNQQQTGTPQQRTSATKAWPLLKTRALNPGSCAPPFLPWARGCVWRGDERVYWDASPLICWCIWLHTTESWWAKRNCWR